MNGTFRRNLILITAIVYMIFACSYVLFCRRNVRIVNVIDCFNSSSSKQNINTLSIEKSSSTNHSPFSHVFLSRPRVISNRSVSLNFSLIIITFLFLFTYYNLKNQSQVFFKDRRFLYLHTDIKFYQCFRI
jgi:Na+/melibiose symporter-like transporter